MIVSSTETFARSLRVLSVVCRAKLESSSKKAKIHKNQLREKDMNSVVITAASCILGVQRCDQPGGPSDPIATEDALELRRCALDPRNKLCQMKASLRRSSISFSVQSLVGKACKNIKISWKFIFTNCSDHFTRNAAQTYR